VNLETGRNRRLIVEMPPRAGKSKLGSVYFPSQYLGRHPDREVLLTSATSDLAERFSIESRDLLDEYGQEYFGVRVRQDVRSRTDWRLVQGGGLRAAGVGGAIMGHGADLLVIDDYFKNVEEAISEAARKKLVEWYLSTSSTRLSPNGAVVIIATRWHRNDLIGHLLQSSDEQWRRVRLPCLAEENDPLGRVPGEALWPERFSLDWCLARKREYEKSGYHWMWEALYQQNPPEHLDAEFPAAYFGDAVWFDEWPEYSRIRWKVLALDPSLGKTDRADYSAFVMLAFADDGTVYVDADLERRNAFRIVEDGIAWIQGFCPDVFAVETNQFQALLAEMFWREANARGMVVNVQGINSDMSKPVRIRMRLTEPLARGWLRFRRGSPGAALLVEQLKGFPATKYDDGPDALEMGLRMGQHLLTEGIGDDGMVREERVSA
jgi:predicted phage terminase large subunit-like protein